MYSELFSGVNVSYLTVSTGDVLNDTNNYEAFQQFKICFEDNFRLMINEGSVMKYSNFRISQSHIGFSIHFIEHLVELFTEWIPDGKFRKFDTPICTDYVYEKEIMDAVNITGELLLKAYIDYHW